MLRPGRKPSWTACLATENEPVIAAWEAMIVATVERITIANRPPAGTSSRNGLLTRPVGQDQRTLPE